MIVVHHLDHSRSQRALWLLEELGLDYEIRHYARDPETMLAPASLMAVHPLGKSPVIVDGDKTLAESGAILEYLVETYGAGRFAPPPGSQNRLRYAYFMHYAEGSLMPPLAMKLVFTQSAAPRAASRPPDRRRDRIQGARLLRRSANRAPSRLSRGRTRTSPLVRRRRVLGGRHSDELSPGSGRLPRRARRAPAQTLGFPATHSRTARPCARRRQGRPDGLVKPPTLAKAERSPSQRSIPRMGEEACSR